MAGLNSIAPAVLDAPAITASPDPGDLLMRRRPARGVWRLLKEVLKQGGPGYIQFAITSHCNARCRFCGFALDRLDPRQRGSVALPGACDAIDICARHHLGCMLFVGGEPLLHPDLPAMVRHAAQRGLRPMVCTNGALWTEQNVRALAHGGLRGVIMSIDAHDVVRHERHRRLPGVCHKIQRANQMFAALGIQTIASITVSRLIDDYRQLPGFLTRLGFQSCTFSYPLTALGSSYRGCSHSPLVAYQPEELLDIFEQLRELKRRTRFPVLNPSASLREMQRHLRGEREQFSCLGGRRFFYLDWNLNLYRCHNWETPLCHIYDFDPTKEVRDRCTRCMIDCYRDASVLQFIAISASDAYHHLRQGRVGAAARSLLDRRNLTSLQAVWEARVWIRQFQPARPSQGPRLRH